MTPIRALTVTRARALAPDQVAQKKTNARFAATREQGGTLPFGSAHAKGKVRPWPYPYPYP